MKQGDIHDFGEMLADVFGIYGKEAGQRQAVMWFRLLADHPLQTVRAAFDAHARDTARGKFCPTPADILAQIEAAAHADGRPGAEEAWALALRADDERHTVVWTAETAQAWGIARPVMQVGDEVGARMAFREAYARLVAEARAAREPVRWSPSLGHDQAQQDDALRIGVESGKLPAAYLPAPRSPVAGLLELSKQRGCPPDVKRRLEEIRAQIVGAKPGEYPGADWHHKQHTIDLKAAAKAAVDAAMKRAEGGDGNEC